MIWSGKSNTLPAFKLFLNGKKPGLFFFCKDKKSATPNFHGVAATKLYILLICNDRKLLFLNLCSHFFEQVYRQKS